MNEKPPQVRTGMKVAVVLFTATMITGYVAYSHYNSQRPMRSRKSPAILEEMRLIDDAKGRTTFEQENPVAAPGDFDDVKEHLKEYEPLASKLTADSVSFDRPKPPLTWVGNHPSEPEFHPSMAVMHSAVMSSTKSGPIFQPPSALYPLEPARFELFKVNSLSLQAAVAQPAPGTETAPAGPPVVVAPGSKSIVLPVQQPPKAP